MCPNLDLLLLFFLLAFFFTSSFTCTFHCFRLDLHFSLVSVWVSYLAYPNLIGTKGLVVVVIGIYSLCAVIRASVPKMILDDVFEQKNEIAKAVENELEKAMSAYGYEIVQTLIVDIEPDVNVKRAMNEINAGMYKLHFPFYPW
jgi:hypothetical protein